MNVQNYFRFAMVLAIAVVLGCSNPNSSSENEESARELVKTSEKFSKIQTEFDEMMSVLNLEAEASAKLTQVHETNFQKWIDWDTEFGLEISEIRKKALDAAKDKDLRRIKEMNAQGDKDRVAALVNQERELRDSYYSELFEAIPEEERQIWKAHTVAKKLLIFLGPVDLTDDQAIEIRTKAKDAILLVKVNENWRGAGTAQLEKLFENQIIRPDQKAAFEKLKKEQPMRQLKWQE